MSGMNGTDYISTHTLVEAGDILRTLNPPIVASLLYLLDDATYTQEEIANNIGSSRSSVSQYQQSLSTLPLPLATKQGYRYRITPAGETLIAHLNKMADRLNVELYSLDWQSEANHEKVESLLTPLYDSRSTMPFFVLESVGTQSAVGDRIDRLSTPQHAWIEDVVQDVKNRQQERGESSTSAQIRQTIRRFSDKDVIEIDDNRITLTKKGHEHAVLLERVAQLIKEQAHISESEEEERNATASETASPPDVTEADQAESSEPKHESGNIAQQIQPQGFLGNRSSATDQVDTQESFLIVPTYCLDFTDEATTSGESHSQFQPVLPLTTQTVGELADQVEQLVQDHGEDVQLVPYWMLQTTDGLYPLESVDESPSPSDVSKSENE